MRFLPPSAVPGISGLKFSTSAGLPASPSIVRVVEPLVAPAPPVVLLVSPEQALAPAAVSMATAHTSADVLYLRAVIVRSFHRAPVGSRRLAASFGPWQSSQLEVHIPVSPWHQWPVSRSRSHWSPVCSSKPCIRYVRSDGVDRVQSHLLRSAARSQVRRGGVRPQRWQIGRA